jgi:hypothetical protein
MQYISKLQATLRKNLSSRSRQSKTRRIEAETDYMVKHLNGNLVCSRDNGTEFRISFRAGRAGARQYG